MDAGWRIDVIIGKTDINPQLNIFRMRFGTDGVEKLLKVSVSLFEKREVVENQLLIATTVQEKNIFYPTVARLHKKIIEGCWKISEKEDIELRQYYKRILGQLMINQWFRKHFKRKEKAMAAVVLNMMKRLRQIPNAIFCFGFTDRRLFSKICYSTDLLKNKSCS